MRSPRPSWDCETHMKGAEVGPKGVEHGAGERKGSPEVATVIEQGAGKRERRRCRPLRAACDVVFGVRSNKLVFLRFASGSEWLALLGVSKTRIVTPPQQRAGASVPRQLTQAIFLFDGECVGYHVIISSTPFRRVKKTDLCTMSRKSRARYVQNWRTIGMSSESS